MRITLPGPETVTLTGQTIDKLIRAGNGDAALLYLYIQKKHGQSSPKEAETALGKSKGEIATAMAVLSRLGLINLNDNNGKKIPDAPPIEVSDNPPNAGPEQYTAEDIQRELDSGSDFHALVDEAQRSLGKILPADELLRLYGIYNGLKLPTEVIMQLITHCITESRRRDGGRMPSMKYIEKTAYTWEHEGIFSLDRAEEYLKAHETRKSARGEIKNSLLIRGRELSETERHYVDNWIAMGFNAAAVAIAYDRTVLLTGQLSWPYMDKIINSWHNKGLHTAQEIQEKDKRPLGKPAFIEKSTKENKFGAATQEDLERMQRLLKNIREE